jgi:dodecin
MAEGVYVVNEIVGTSTESWEDAAMRAIETAAESVQDLRVAEVVKQDVIVEVSKTTHYSKVTHYRVRLNISFKYHPGWKEEHLKT